MELTMANKKEQGFNDAELQDIMSEIENLEREYEDDAPVSSKRQAEVVTHEQDSASEPVAETSNDNIVNFEPQTETQAVSGDQQVEFQGSGQMSFSMNFEVAGQTAHLEITEAGLVVSLDGMHLSVNDIEGCTVKMDGGVKFSVPMKTKEKSSKAA
jgi:hypothetical protein